MRPSAATIERLARLLLLVCTILGLAALHTVGRDAVTDAHQDARTAMTAGSVPAMVSPAVTSRQADDCAGERCAYPVTASSGTHEISHWWDACVAVLNALGIGLFAAGLFRFVRVNSPAISRGVLRRRPASAEAFRVGLALATTAVIRT